MKFTAFILFACVSLYGCGFGGDRVKGNGNIVSQERTVSSFDEVTVGGNFRVFIQQGDIKPVKIEGDENLLEFVEFVQTGDELKIRVRDGVNLSSDEDIKLYLTAPNYKRIQASGASNIIGQNKLDNDSDIKVSVSGAGDIRMDIDAPGIETGISGAGNIELKGETKNFMLTISGAGKARCFDLKSENTEVHISGAGDADVFASNKLSAKLSGAGSVSYKGDPKEVDQHVSGAGSVKKS